MSDPLKGPKSTPGLPPVRSHVLETIKKRYSCRRYLPDHIDRSMIVAPPLPATGSLTDFIS